ncbi:hypothetical protein CF70_014350 [Cupriavidus sp. SK-3]|uniref:hypothetical protein n=1 Tax=Cupriavidus sp. SK-3 TaxID=1470558 RepID=UPI00044CFDBF|nr:hypothetical protein [Cupriavidus sp. SK-3]KDP85345.1 hypothetical protein CF70_014350 [Cupriavidus sp. SK-3]
MFACDIETVFLFRRAADAVAAPFPCERITVDDPLLTADTWNPEAEAAAQATGATLVLNGIDTAAIMALPWTIDHLEFNYRGAWLSFLLAYSIQFTGPRSICLRTRGERHYATRQEVACSL